MSERRVLGSVGAEAAADVPPGKGAGAGCSQRCPVCAAAQELFADCIVSHMTVAEAMAAGTMPVPSAYAALLWPQEEELATLRARIKNLCMPKGDTLPARSI